MSSSTSKRVLITGATGALGQVAVQKYLNSGFQVTGTTLESSSQPSSQGSGIQWLPVDLADPKKVKNIFSDLHFDVMVHCAGGFRYSPADTLADQDFDFLMDANLKSAFYLVRELLPKMKKQNFGRIVFVSSKATLHAGAGMAAYAASKAGLNQLTSALAEEVKKYNINVNAVLPSVIDTPANRKDMPQADFSQWVTPEQLVEIIFSLTSSWGNPIHGALIPVAGRV
jgi:3-oxoacyl-[acyl-carrier protein] reductase